MLSKEADGIAFIEHHPSSDYQEYLCRYADNYRRHKLAAFQAFAGETFVHARGSRIEAVAQMGESRWDSECFGFRVDRIPALYGTNVHSLVNVLNQAVSQARQTNTRLIVCRVSYTNLAAIHAMEDVGFHLADAMSILLWDDRAGFRTDHRLRDGMVNGLTIESMPPDEAAHREVLAIGATAFRHSRVSNDPTFTPEQIERFHRQLLDSALQNPSPASLLARVEGQVAGFIIGDVDELFKEHVGVSLGYLKLIAVADNFMGRGIGRHLVQQFLPRMAEQTRLIEVGTQIDNDAALNLYSSCNAKFVSSVATFHLWL